MKTTMDYSKAADWIIGEKAFDSRLLGKCESIMCLGNGYFCIRSAAEERYVREKRDCFVAGTFNKFDENEVTELPNAADLMAMDLELNGQPFTLEQGEIKFYYRQLNLKTGELTRTVDWLSPDGDEYRFVFERIVSMKEKHVAAQRISVTPVTRDTDFLMITGIDGSMNNSGVQHFSEGDKRFYEGKIMQACQTTTQSGIGFVLTAQASFTLNKEAYTPKQHIAMERRKIFCEYQGTVPAGKTLVMEKVGNIYTTRDREMEKRSLKELQEYARTALENSAEKGYKALAAESAAMWLSLIHI